MCKFGHALCRLILTLTLLASGFFDGMARAEVTGVGQMEIVICADDGVATLVIDANGNPVLPANSHDRHCPDCLVTAIGSLPMAAVQPIAYGRGREISSPSLVLQRPIDVSSTHRARAPPIKV